MMSELHQEFSSGENRSLVHLKALIALTERYQNMILIFDEKKMQTRTEWFRAEETVVYNAAVAKYCEENALDNRTQVKRLLNEANIQSALFFDVLHNAVVAYAHCFHDSIMRMTMPSEHEDELLDLVQSAHKEYALMDKTRSCLQITFDSVL